MQVNPLQRPSNSTAAAPGRCRILITVLLAMSLYFVGCDEEAIQTYPAPKDAIAPIDAHAGHDRALQPSLSVPEGWETEPRTSPMVFAAFRVGAANNSARVTVTPLGGDGGGLLQNINRWRGQIGLPPVDAPDRQPTEKLTVDDQAADMFDLTGPANQQGSAKRILVAIVLRPQQGRTWFFKMTGTDQIVGRHKQDFVQFVESFGFAGGQG